MKKRSTPSERRHSNWGGRRPGAGRKAGPRPRTLHRARPEHDAEQPVHATLKAKLSLRKASIFPTLEMAIAEANRRAPDRFQVVHYSVQSEVLHLIVEASDSIALSAGIRGVAVRVARRVNQRLGREGQFWDDRWRGRVLTSPGAVRDALVFLFGSFRRRDPKARAAVDPYSSAPYFTGFHELEGRAPIDVKPSMVRLLAPSRPAVEPRTWLLRAGWRKSGPLSLSDAPETGG